ncbi:MAG: dihydrodipicolinate synthase family protein [Halanaeroarchaeum sp.]
MHVDMAGVNPAPVVPMTAEGETIDEAGLRRHLDVLVETRGVNGLVMNGHAGEVYGLDPTERARVVEIAADVADDGTPVVSGITGGSTSEVIDAAWDAVEAGADGLLVVPPHTPISERREAAVTYVERIAGAIDVPLVIFQHPLWAGGTYPPETLAEIVEVEGVTAVKNAVWDVDHFQDDVRAIRDSDADVQVLVGNDEHVLPSFSLGTDGAVLELAAVIPEEIVDLYRAVEDGHPGEARRIYERIEPFVDAMYAPPIADSHTRLKVALAELGVFEHATPRPPAMPVPDEERERIAALIEGPVRVTPSP